MLQLTKASSRPERCCIDPGWIQTLKKTHQELFKMRFNTNVLEKPSNLHLNCHSLKLLLEGKHCILSSIRNTWNRVVGARQISRSSQTFKKRRWRRQRYSRKVFSDSKGFMPIFRPVRELLWWWPTHSENSWHYIWFRFFWYRYWIVNDPTLNQGLQTVNDPSWKCSGATMVLNMPQKSLPSFVRRTESTTKDQLHILDIHVIVSRTQIEKQKALFKKWKQNYGRKWRTNILRCWFHHATRSLLHIHLDTSCTWYSHNERSFRQW